MSPNWKTFREMATPLLGTSEHLEQLFDSGQLRDYLPGERIVDHGQKQDLFYLLLIGEVEAHIPRRSGFSLVRRLGQGDFFGEMGIFTRVSASASIKAVSSVTVWLTQRRELEHCLERFPSLGLHFYRWIIQILASRLESVYQEPSIDF